jgi:hypothetical protein
MRPGPREFESAFAAMEKDRPDAIIVQPSLPSKRAAELALKCRRFQCRGGSPKKAG